jgi:FtsZ-binding cell division protein ZapB
MASYPVVPSLLDAPIQQLQSLLSLLRENNSSIEEIRVSNANLSHELATVKLDRDALSAEVEALRALTACSKEPITKVNKLDEI